MAFTEQAETVVNYPLNGSATQFTIPFDYLARSFIMVSLFAESKEEKLQDGIDYNFTSPTSIQTVKPYGGGDGWERIQLRRYTSASPLVEFIDGSVLRSDDLNLSALQSLHIAQEARDSAFDMLTVNTDGVYDAKGRRITNMASGVEDSDAITIGQMKEWDDKALVQANRAESEADRSEREANKAKGYAESALVSEKLASTSEQNAKSSEQNAKSSELVATQAASDAAASAQYARESIELTEQHVVESKETIEQVRKDADRAEEAANRVNDVLTHVSSIEKLKALDYAPNNTHVYVDSYYEGKNIGGGIFVLDKDSTETPDDGYCVAASGGGVWKRSVTSFLTFDMFGADSTGVKDAHEEIQKCFTAAHSLGLRVVQTNGQFTLNNSSDIIIKVSTDVTGSVFKPKNVGKIVITRDNQWVEHSTDSDVVKNFKNSADLRKGSSKVSGIFNTEDKTIDDSYIQIVTNQPFFKYRGNAITRKDYNIMMFKGQLSSPMLYDLLPDTITSIRALRMSQTWITIKGFSFDESEYIAYDIIRIENATKVNLMETSYHNRGDFRKVYVTRLSVSNSAHIYVDNVYCSDVNGTPTNEYTYSVSLSDSYHVYVKGLQSEGIGWGSTGSNNCQRVWFVDCQMSRLDFHQPVREWLIVENCTIGNWGILATIIGDLHINDCRYQQRDAYNNSGLFRSRGDTGGWCDGNVYVRNLTIGGNRGANTGAEVGLPMFDCQVNSGNGEVPNSPINFRFFEVISIDGVTFEDNNRNYVMDVINSNSFSIRIPSIIILNNIIVKQRFSKLNFNMRQFRTVASDPSIGSHYRHQAPTVNLSNIFVNHIGFYGKDWKHSPVVTMNNVRAYDYEGNNSMSTSLYVELSCRMYINNCMISQLNTGWGQNPKAPQTIQMTGGTIGDVNSRPIANVLATIYLNGVTVIQESWQNIANNLQFAESCHRNGCHYVQAGQSSVQSLKLWEGVTNSAITLDLETSVSSYDPQLRVLAGYDSDVSARLAIFTLAGRMTDEVRTFSNGAKISITGEAKGSKTSYTIKATGVTGISFPLRTVTMN